MPDSSKNSDRKPQYNFVELMTLIVVVVTAIANGAKFLAYDRPLASLETRLKQLDVINAESESVSVEGTIYNQDTTIKHNGKTIPVCAVLIRVTNNGQSTVTLKSIDFHVHTATLDGICRSVTVDDANQVVADGVHVGVIDPDSPNWVKRAELYQPVKLGNIELRPGQSRIERRHVLSPSESSALLTKIEVTVKTQKGEHSWYGLGNGGYSFPVCMPVDSAPIISPTGTQP